jgi:hypothetical protein
MKCIIENRYFKMIASSNTLHFAGPVSFLFSVLSCLLCIFVVMRRLYIIQERLDINNKISEKAESYLYKYAENGIISTVGHKRNPIQETNFTNGNVPDDYQNDEDNNKIITESFTSHLNEHNNCTNYFSESKDFIARKCPGEISVTIYYSFSQSVTWIDFFKSIISFLSYFKYII